MFRFFTVALIVVWLSYGSCQVSCAFLYLLLYELRLRFSIKRRKHFDTFIFIQEAPAAFPIGANSLESSQLNVTNPPGISHSNNTKPLDGPQLNGTNPSTISDTNNTNPIAGSQSNETNPSEIPYLNGTISLEMPTLNVTTPVDVLDLNDTNRLEPQHLNDAFILNTISTNQTNDRNPIGDWIIGIIGRPTTEATVQLDPPEKCDECS